MYEVLGPLPVMFVRLLALFAAILLGSCSVERTSVPVDSAVATKPAPDRFFINFTPIRHLYCGEFTGTGSIIDQDRVLTANHVVGAVKECRDEDSDTVGQVIYQNPALDIAVIQFPVAHLPKRRMQYNCKGFEPGKIYYAIGWQNGTELVVNRVEGTKVFDNRADHSSGTLFNHVALVRGYIIPGMSGGPIVDEKGVMVGTNQATNHDGRSWARPITDTYLCDDLKTRDTR
jgi:S1-C subfamily serine protease